MQLRTALFQFCLLFVCLNHLFSSTAYAQNSNIIVIAPACLTHQLPGTPTILASHNTFHLLKLKEQDIQILNAAKKEIKNCGGFIDVTEAYHERKMSVRNFLKTALEPHLKPLIKQNYEIRYEKEVNDLLKHVNPENMWQQLTALTQFPNRAANSEEGVKAANWLKDQVSSIVSLYQSKDVHIEFIKTGTRFSQPSLLVRVGKDENAAVVIGAHMDTLNSYFSAMPGADDDGSGCVTVLEIFRTLMSAQQQFKNPIYFVWYAAEEKGLVGSQFVVREFEKRNISVNAVLHFDMTGYAYRNDPTMWLMDDYVDPGVSAFLEQLIKTYIKRPIGHSACGYGCSDHASWTKAGYRAGIAAEAAYENTNPNMHSKQDTMDKLSLAHMTDYAKLALAFAVELAEPQPL